MTQPYKHGDVFGLTPKPQRGPGGTFIRYANAQGWGAETQIGLLLGYIEQEGSSEAFRAYLAQAAAWDNQTT